MYAVIKTGGKQYRVAEGDVVRVEKLNGAEGDTVELDKVLMVGRGRDEQALRRLADRLDVRELHRLLYRAARHRWPELAEDGAQQAQLEVEHPANLRRRLDRSP